MTWRLHGGNPIIAAGGTIGLSDSCCCRPNCTMPCAPYTSFDVMFTIENDSINNITPECSMWQWTGTWTPNPFGTNPYCWPFPGLPPAGPFPNSRLPWLIVNRIKHTTSGLKGLEFSVNLPLTQNQSSGCCRFIPTGSPSTINGDHKRIVAADITDVCELTLANYWDPTQTVIGTVTQVYEYSFWLGANCQLNGPDGGRRMVFGYLNRTTKSVTLSVPTNCNCNVAIPPINCVPWEALARFDELLIYPNDTALAGVDPFQIPFPSRRLGTDCVQATYEDEIELVRPNTQLTCNQLVVSTKAPFVFSVEGAP